MMVSPRLYAATSDLTGSWIAAPMIVQWNIESWGEACGPRPRGGTEPGGSVQIDKTGNELLWRGLSRSYSTSQCWERLPGIARVSHSASKTRWVNVCKKPANDPRKAQLRTVVTAQENRILFDETGQFSFYVKDAKCAANSRRTRTLRRVVATNTAAKAKGQGNAISDDKNSGARVPAGFDRRKATVVERSTKSCRPRGAASTLEILSQREFVQAGDDLQLTAIVKDRNGCSFRDSKIQWSIDGEVDRIEVLPNGRLNTVETSPSRTVEVRAESGGLSTTLPIRVASRSEYAAIFSADASDRSWPKIGDLAPGGAAHIQPEQTIEVHAEGSASSRKRTFLLLLLGTVLALAGFGVWLLRTSRAKGLERAPMTITVLDTRTETKCPTCGEMYPAGTRFCGTDGTRLD